MTTLKNAKKLTDKDLQQVTGGAIYCSAFGPQAGVWSIVDDNSGKVINKVADCSLASGYNMAVQVAQDCGQSTRQISWAELNQQRNQYSVPPFIVG